MGAESSPQPLAPCSYPVPCPLRAQDSSPGGAAKGAALLQEAPRGSQCATIEMLLHILLGSQANRGAKGKKKKSCKLNPSPRCAGASASARKHSPEGMRVTLTPPMTKTLQESGKLMGTCVELSQAYVEQRTLTTTTMTSLRKAEFNRTLP